MFEELARTILGSRIRFQTFSSQIEELLTSGDSRLAEQIQYKSTNSFVTELEKYLQYAEDKFFAPRNLQIGNFHITKEDIKQSYTNLKDMPIKKRLKKITSNIITKDKNQTVPLLSKDSAKLVKKEINSMFFYPDALSLYINFYTFIGHEEYFSMRRKNILGHSDVFPLIYVKLFLEGTPQNYRAIKHLLIDEMQDYAPVQYAVLAKLFSCKMTILGDLYQSVNPYSSSSADKISPYFKECTCIELQKSYRSTYEIMELVQNIQRNDKLIPMERHGEKPRFHSCTGFDSEVEKIYQILLEYKKSNYTSLGILCKTQKDADVLYHVIKLREDNVSLLDFKSDKYTEGIIITTIHMAKGLEFDWAIISDVSRQNYKSEIDKGLLYIACTRAMHKLDLTFSGYITDYLTYESKAIQNNNNH
ncbi:3'-5' exonuclease [Muricomes intestini]|uniref:UvrD-like helicase family protein n=1 Tax=Muricomes intestini TaxID=1796634 RepID=A0A4R3KG28_9FIRM|nr:3'-5' exonuclease [Muricomes intestini]TCS82258.1 UvrD-like helicase family protein [Muricomes intestini]